MLGISPALMERRLNVDPTHKQVVCKKRHLGPKRAAMVMTEVQKLLEADFIRECEYPEWISNIVLVKKTDGTRRCASISLT